MYSRVYYQTLAQSTLISGSTVQSTILCWGCWLSGFGRQKSPKSAFSRERDDGQGESSCLGLEGERCLCWGVWGALKGPQARAGGPWVSPGELGLCCDLWGPAVKGTAATATLR